MSAFDSAWTLLKLLPSEEKKFGQGYGDFETEEYDPATGNYFASEEYARAFDKKHADMLGAEMDDDNTVFYEDFGPVPVEDYYNADWHINHPNPHIHEDLPPRDELQALLDREKEMADYRKVMDAPPPRRTPQMDDDPFRMKGPDMSDQISQILAEIRRRKERKSLRNVFNEDGTGKPEFDKYGVMDRTRELGEFDRIDPQDTQLLNFTRPQMRDRLDALQAEFARRSAKRAGKQ